MPPITISPSDLAGAPNWALFDRAITKGTWWLRRCDESCESLVRGILMDCLSLELTPFRSMIRMIENQRNPETIFIQRLDERTVAVFGEKHPDLDIVLTFTFDPKTGVLRA